MANSVVEENEVYLNGVYYPTTRPVRSTLASIYPAKIVIGDTSKDSQLRSSIVAWSDWRGGIGINRMEGAGDVNRAWFSQCQLRYKNHLVLPGLVTETSAPSHSLTDATIGAINTLDGDVYAFWNGSVSESPKLYKFANASDSWGSELTQSAADQVTDSVIYTAPSGTSYLVFAHYDTNGSGITYSSNGSTWKTDTNRGAQFVTVWDERLWAITNAGQLWYIAGDLDTDSSVDNSEVLDAMLPTPDGTVTKLFVARNAMGLPVIYAATKEGLFMHNADNAMFEATQMTFPTHPNNGKGTATWRDSVYIPSGNAIYKYINGNNAAVISVVGPDRDDGLPSDKRGGIHLLSGTHNELLAGVDATTAPSTISSTSVPYQWQSTQGSPVIAPDTGYSSILGYNDMGWETKWLSSTSGKGLDSMHVTSAYDKYRVYWGHNNKVHYMALPSDIINPSQVVEFAYATSAIHETPWFNAGQSEVDKLALTLRIEAQDLSAADKEIVKIEYATDYNESYTTAVATLNSSTMYAQTGVGDGSSGTYTYPFVNAGTEVPEGITFRSIKFKLTLERDDDDTTGLEKFNTPDVVSLTLSFRKKIPAKWGHTVDVDLTREYKGNVPKDLRSNLVDAIESKTLVEFTFRDDSGGTRNYYVDVVAAQGMEFTGYDERGSTTIQVVEP